MKKGLLFQPIAWVIFFIGNFILAILGEYLNKAAFGLGYIVICGLVIFAGLTWHLKYDDDKLLRTVLFFFAWCAECVACLFISDYFCDLIYFSDLHILWIDFDTLTFDFLLVLEALFALGLGIIYLTTRIVSKIFANVYCNKIIEFFVWCVTIIGTIAGNIIIFSAADYGTFGTLSNHFEIFVEYNIIFQMICIVFSIAATFLSKLFQKRYIAYIVWVMLIVCTMIGNNHFMNSHRTYYKYNDRKIVGKTLEQVQSIYGEFDEMGKNRVSYYIYYANYYDIYYENGIVTRVEHREIP
ncbi:MAG: hypothetical protein ACI4AQ_01665 [Lachnospiraceae bacterium]